MSIEVINPATEEVVRTVEEHDDDHIETALARAEKAARSWKTTPFAERTEVLRAAARDLKERSDEHARLMVTEMGKPLAAARSEAEKCAWVCEYYADHAEEFLAPEPRETDASSSFVRFDPIGPVLAVMPWNFPYWQVFRFAAPAIAAGNVGLLKHASNVPGCSEAIAEIFRRAGAPEGVFQSLLIPSEKVEGVIGDERVRAVTLTGSEPAGRAVAKQAGAALKKTVLELGGSDAFVVLEDADIDRAAKQAAKARTINSGQSCIAAKRFLVVRSVADRFEKALVREMESLKVGDPMDEANDLGPLAREDLLDDLHDQVERSVEAGAVLATGGKRLDRTGYYYAPTVLTSVEPGMAAFDEETFGPAAAVVRADDADHAVELANLSPYGLGGSVWTGNAERGKELAARIEAGCVFVNEIVKSDPRMPFGGIKNSGYGRELSAFGIREFVNIKTVWVA